MDCKLIVEKIDPMATLPSKSHPGDAGFDLFVTHYESSTPSYCDASTTSIVMAHTGIRIQLPDGYFGMIKDRSSVAKLGIHVVGGVIDTGYRGEIIVMLMSSGSPKLNPYPKLGSRIAQLILLPNPEFQVLNGKVSDDTSRGTSGFGSSGE